jgi:hypothetical protein
MTKKLIVIVLFILGLSVGIVAFKGQASSPVIPSQGVATQTETLPIPMLYRHLFHHIVALNKKADEAQLKGEDGLKYKSFYQNRAQLNDTQATKLSDIAKTCDQQVALLDEQAQQIIEAARAAYPQGKLLPGQAPPPPPTELKLLQERRTAIILQAYDQLREAFGEEAFNRFHQFVKEAIRPDSSMLPQELRRPQGQRQPALLSAGQQRVAH